jgi:hypothetical protein
MLDQVKKEIPVLTKIYPFAVHDGCSCLKFPLKKCNIVLLKLEKIRIITNVLNIYNSSNTINSSNTSEDGGFCLK